MRHGMGRRALLIAGVVGALILGSLAVASAGHTNVLLYAELDGNDEVATGATNNGVVGDPNGRGEAYVFGIDGDPNTLCYVLTVDKIATAAAAHIHKADAGVNGPIVVHLAAPADGNSADCVTQGETLTGGGPVFATGQTVADILANPDDYYVNVHNADYPGGAIRGQLAPQG